MTIIETNSSAIVTLPNEALLRLAETLDPAWAAISDGFAIANCRTNMINDGGITITFTKNVKVDTAAKAEVKAEPEFVFADTRRQIVRNALFGRDSYIYAEADVQAKVEELVITAWMESGTSDSLSDFTRPWYSSELYPQYEKNGNKFPFQVPAWEPTAKQIEEVLDDLNSRFSFAPRTAAQKIKIINDLLRAWHAAGEMLTLGEFSFPWYRDNKVNYPA